MALSWDVVRYADRLTLRDEERNETREANLKDAYPAMSGQYTLLMDWPGTVTDLHGIILAWYLPEALS